jgi:UDP-glucose 4-epimerase
MEAWTQTREEGVNTEGTDVLVTGGAGFIGSELVRQLRAIGHRVIVADNLRSGKRENIEDVLGDDVELIVADIRDEAAMAGLFRRVRVVYHLACLGVRHSIHSPVENHSVNATGTLGLLMQARTAGIDRFVYVSSSEVYGTAQYAPMDENHPAFPHTVYGASKLAGECYARSFFQTYGFPVAIVRPFNTFGPRSHHEGDSGEVIPKFMLRCMAGLPMVVFGDGTQTRDFTFVNDTARGIILAGFSDGAVGRTINLGAGRECSIADLALRVEEVVGRPGAKVIFDKPRPGDVGRLLADTTRSRELLGFEPRVSLHDGLVRLREWYESMDTPLEDLVAQESIRNWEPQRMAESDV